MLGRAGAPAEDVVGVHASLDQAMARYAQGDDTAFPELARGLVPKLRVFLGRIAGRADSADDLVQETLMRMHRARGSFTPGSPVLPWAYSIGRNCFFTQMRAKTWRVLRHSVDVTEVELATRAELGAEAAVTARQSAEVVAAALASMPLANREAFVLLRYEGLSVSTAAQIVGISNSALKLRAFRAYELLRAALAQAGVHSSKR